MVPADSQQIPRARCYSGNPTTHMPLSSTTGLSPSPAGHSKPLHLTTMRKHDDGSHRTSGPTTPHTQPLPGITCTRFSLIHVRSPLLAESLLFSSPTGTEMFHFPASTPTQTMYSPAGNTTQPVLGFPIRTSSDQRLIDNSPRLNAAFHVLHRLSMPRHPPCALNNEHTNHHTQKARAATQVNLTK